MTGRSRSFSQWICQQIDRTALWCAVLAVCGMGHADAQLSVPSRQSETAPAVVNGAYLAQHLPRIHYHGGPFLRHPRIVTVTFAADRPDAVTLLERFGNAVTRTLWWRLVVAGYCATEGDCIGDGLPGLAVRVNDALSTEIRAVDISALLKRDARAGRFGTLDSNSLLLVYLPPGVNLSDAFARYCGAGPRGFHRALRLDGKSVPYAVIPRCGDLSETTTTASHELLEATANPDNPHRGFAFAQSSANLGFTSAGVEPVDACGLISGDFRQTNESGFIVQRAWSNVAASMGHDPCVPATAHLPFVALVPMQAAVPLVNAGDHALITLVAAADRPVGEWSVSAIDLSASQGGEPCTTVALDRTTIAPGHTASLSITRLVPRTTHVCVVGIVSKLDGRAYLWPLAVGQP